STAWRFLASPAGARKPLSAFSRLWRCAPAGSGTGTVSFMGTPPYRSLRCRPHRRSVDHADILLATLTSTPRSGNHAGRTVDMGTELPQPRDRAEPAGRWGRLLRSERRRARGPVEVGAVVGQQCRVHGAVMIGTEEQTVFCRRLTTLGVGLNVRCFEDPHLVDPTSVIGAPILLLRKQKLPESPLVAAPTHNDFSVIADDRFAVSLRPPSFSVLAVYSRQVLGPGPLELIRDVARHQCPTAARTPHRVRELLGHRREIEGFLDSD